MFSMIVNYTDRGWEIISQRAHGLLAAQAAMAWRVKDRPERWTETVLSPSPNMMMPLLN